MSDFFEDLENTKPFLKIAFEGFAGTGKTFTAVDLAIGLHRHIASTKPVALFDTEEAGKFALPILDGAGLQGKIRRSRSLADLEKAMQLCAEGFADILVIDSISHVWEDFLGSYRRKRRGQQLQFQDWGVIKPTWKERFSDPFVRLPVHILMCGRAGYEYSQELVTDETTGKQRREIYKSGVKMKVEGETAYEPDILVLMERYEHVVDPSKPHRVYRQATILKDRSTLLDGKQFRQPRFENFQPAVDRILLNGNYKKAPTQSDAAELFETERSDYKERKILHEEIKGLLIKHLPSRSAADTTAKQDLLQSVFGTRSWTAIESLDLGTLKNGLLELRVALGEAETGPGEGSDDVGF